MEKNKDFRQKIVNLSNRDLERLYEIASERIAVISAELTRRREKNEPPIEKVEQINDPTKTRMDINDPAKMGKSITREDDGR